MKEFQQSVKHVQKKCSELLKSKHLARSDFPREHKSIPGIYLFSEKGWALYVGRTNKLGWRISSHTHSSHHIANFAFLIAKYKTKTPAKTKKTRSELMKNKKFKAAFDKARQRIKAMDIQIIKERNSVKQALLEICVASRTKAKYNNFDNH